MDESEKENIVLIESSANKIPEKLANNGLWLTTRPDYFFEGIFLKINYSKKKVDKNLLTLY